ncbi:MAG: tRNA preQ1(34) S-adenosylmethionine ribosyltransferase-isomerase QueA [Nitrospirae bacterium]|nr:tRNA preQ1(34) S-adenosylmethionine ribosyltransferase-isomerase QueA [Nitrospirota bacterium]
MRVADFDFCLPQGLIAKRPLKKRDSSRLLVLHRDGQIEHKKFFNLPEYINPGDMLLLNNTKVFPARLKGLKKTGGSLDILLIKENEENVWEIISKGKYTGVLEISEELKAEIYVGRVAKFICSGSLRDIIWKYGNMPLPPYIKRSPDEKDKKSYQTVYAKEEGSIAAPTAGLHFTEELLKTLNSMGVLIREVTLSVGIGTFMPIRTTHVEEHVMKEESFKIERSLISEISEVKNSGKSIFSVGTTTTRAIEGYMSGNWSLGIEKEPDNGSIHGFTNLFIYPGYKFKAVDSLITNFHLPKSTPLMLVAAFCGWKKLKKSYEEAISSKYRFFSYGDAMLIL